MVAHLVHQNPCEGRNPRVGDTADDSLGRGEDSVTHLSINVTCGAALSRRRLTELSSLSP